MATSDVSLDRLGGGCYHVRAMVGRKMGFNGDGPNNRRAAAMRRWTAVLAGLLALLLAAGAGAVTPRSDQRGPS